MHVIQNHILKAIFFIILLPLLSLGDYSNIPYVQKNEPEIVFNTGYFISPKFLDDYFFHYKIVNSHFIPKKIKSPFKINEGILNSFEPIILSLEYYIKDEKKGAMINCEKDSANCNKSFTDINGISELELAAEITKASYCFGTDPYMVASKIRQESRFDMTSVSNTGAVGLTQLTTPGLKEILDQLGHRGEKYAFLENRNFLVNAVECYAEQSLHSVFTSFPQVKTVAVKGNQIEYTPETLKQLKAWILPSKTYAMSGNKKPYIQRQIFMGQMLFKIYLAYSKKLHPTLPTLRHYDSALRMFNGDVIRVKYAKDVIKFSKPQIAL